MTTKTNPIIWFDGRESTRTLPPECIAECSASGDQTDTVRGWVEELNFDGPVDQFKEYLDGFGCWDDEELNNITRTDVGFYGCGLDIVLMIQIVMITCI